MKQLVAQAIVAVLLVAIVGALLWVIRSRRASVAAGNTALDALARDLGTTWTPSAMPHLSGTYAGRACSLQQSRRPASDDDSRFVRIEVACPLSADFQVTRRKAALDGEFADRVRTGDETFDVQLMARSSDAARAKAVLAPDLRSTLVDWFGRGWMDDLRCRDGLLHIDGGFGLTEGVEVERARLLLQAGVRIADALER
jgi:hypothetical protein